MNNIQIPTIVLPGGLYVTAGAWDEVDAADRTAVVLKLRGGRERTLNPEQSSSFLEQAAVLPLIELPGGLIVTVGAWAEIDSRDCEAVVITYGSGITRTLDKEQSSVFLVKAGIERPRVQPAGAHEMPSPRRFGRHPGH